MTKEQHFRSLENMYKEGPINEIYDPEIRVSEAAAEIEIEIGKKYHHAGASVHGSVYFKMLDDAAYFAAASLLENSFALTSSFTLYFIRPVIKGRIKSVGKVIKRSSNVIFAEAELYDEKERLIAKGSGSFMKSRLKLGPELGYKF